MFFTECTIYRLHCKLQELHIMHKFTNFLKRYCRFPKMHLKWSPSSFSWLPRLNPHNKWQNDLLDILRPFLRFWHHLYAYLRCLQVSCQAIAIGEVCFRPMFTKVYCRACVNAWNSTKLSFPTRTCQGFQIHNVSTSVGWLTSNWGSFCHWHTHMWESILIFSKSSNIFGHSVLGVC